MGRSKAHDNRNKVIREGLSSIAEARAISPSTTLTVTSECHRLGVSLATENVQDGQGAKIHWIGDRSPETVVLYFHGGGFSFSPTPGHVSFIVESQKRLASLDKPFACAFVEYGLTPRVKFPVQHHQAVAALNHLLVLGRKPSDIIVAGDSAGGSLAIGLISASLHSYPGIPLLKLDSPLRGLMAISPWVRFAITSDSFKNNELEEVFDPKILLALSDDFRTSEERNEFSEPWLAGPSWWADAPVSSILVLTGTSEVFHDDIQDLGSTLANAGLSVRTVGCDEQVHIECIHDAGFGLEHGPMSFETSQVVNLGNKLKEAPRGIPKILRNSSTTCMIVKGKDHRCPRDIEYVLTHGIDGPLIPSQRMYLCHHPLLSNANGDSSKVDKDGCANSTERIQVYDIGFNQERE
ncbi:hypothetical protein NM208_g9689 [Fusarium decemcellulare]|uniref:Uncharacterized protein n=1 Tax=Fusarium decemcellulare TaxID=57161 RepID=A0ACC1S0N7_9HYPO|nr:hypothetical protein NM208_g9689 [Fusarium decemcellulare]